MKKEYKIVATIHPYSKLKDKIAYAIVTTTYLVAEPDSLLGYIDLGPSGGYVIASNLEHASTILNNYLYEDHLEREVEQQQSYLETNENLEQS